MKKTTKMRILTLLLIICMMFSCVPVNAVETNETVINDNTVLPVVNDSIAHLRESMTPVLPDLNEYVLSEGDLTTEELKKVTLSTSDIPEIMRNDGFDAEFHVNRLYDQEQSLNTVMFQNIDGTKTMYLYPMDVKYENEEGVVADKSVSMIKADYELSVSEISQSDINLIDNNASVAAYSPPIIDHDGQADNGIHDVSILEAKPYMCTGGAQRTYIGPHANFGRTKTFLRFPYLAVNPVYEMISSDRIVSAEYEVYKEASTYAYPFSVYWYTGMYWDESVINFTTPTDVHSHSPISSTSSQTLPAGEGWTSIDLTQAVIGWKDGTQPISKGVVMYGSSLQIDHRYGQSFYSVEGGIYEGNKVPSLKITWMPETETTINDGEIYSIKNTQGKYLTAKYLPISKAQLSDKIDVYFNDSSGNVTNIVDTSTQGHEQLWCINSLGGGLYSIGSVGICNVDTNMDEFVLSAGTPEESSPNIADVILSTDADDSKSKWMIQEYNNRLYIINYGQPEFCLTCNGTEVYLSKSVDNISWLFERKTVEDIMSDIVLNYDEVPNINFVIEQSAMQGLYIRSVYETGIMNWNGLSYVNLRVYYENEPIPDDAACTVYIKGVESHPYLNDDDYARTVIDPIPINESQKLPPETMEIIINLKNLPSSFKEARRIVSHEVGHALFLNHPHDNRAGYRPVSVMNQGGLGTTNGAAKPTKYDIYNLNKRWG